jgi:hypothetical protein
VGSGLRGNGEVQLVCSLKVDGPPRPPNVEVAAGCIGSYTPRPRNGGQRGI